MRRRRREILPWLSALVSSVQAPSNTTRAFSNGPCLPRRIEVLSGENDRRHFLLLPLRGTAYRRPMSSRAIRSLWTVVCVVAWVSACYVHPSDTDSCVGIVSCPSLEVEKCADESGCSVGERCVGDCATSVTVPTCTMRAECEWRPDAEVCTPIPQRCAEWASKDDCVRALGCLWGIACTGPIRSCREITSRSECSRHTQCQWQTDPEFH